MQFMFWLGLALTVVGIVAALFYLPTWLAFVLVAGVVCLVATVAASAHDSHEENLRRFR